MIRVNSLGCGLPRKYRAIRASIQGGQGLRSRITVWLVAWNASDGSAQGEDEVEAFCIAEDRVSEQEPLRLLIASLKRHIPEARIEVFCPFAKDDDQLTNWIQRWPGVILNTQRLEGLRGYNVKPQALLTMLDKGYQEVIWIDSDVIVAAPGLLELIGHDPEVVVLCEEALYGGHDDRNGWRARQWGFDVGRVFPFTANTGVMRITERHRELLEAWREQMQDPRYLEAQNLSWDKRPPYMYGDQDALTALLCATRFSGIPVKFLYRGKGVIQYFGPYGYTVGERITHLFNGMCPLIHSQVVKPWGKIWTAKNSGIRAQLERLYCDLSPYTMVARRYRKDANVALGWARSHSMAAAALRALGAWSPWACGLPIAAATDGIRLVKRLVRRAKV